MGRDPESKNLWSGHEGRGLQDPND